MALSGDWIAREPAPIPIDSICPIAEMGILRKRFAGPQSFSKRGPLESARR